MAKGYTQQEELDFIDIFFPVAKLVSVKTLLAIAAINKWYLVQFYVNNAFLNEDFFEEIYMDLPLGYSNLHANIVKECNPVCKLHKSIHGLRQAFRQWFLKFSQALIAHGIRQSKSDYSLFTKGKCTSFVASMLMTLSSQVQIIVL